MFSLFAQTTRHTKKMCRRVCVYLSVRAKYITLILLICGRALSERPRAARRKLATRAFTAELRASWRREARGSQLSRCFAACARGGLTPPFILARSHYFSCFTAAAAAQIRVRMYERRLCVLVPTTALRATVQTIAARQVEMAAISIGIRIRLRLLLRPY